MSVGRYIMHQKLSDGSYEDVYCKSESGLIYRPNGRTVEQDLAAYLPEYQNSDTVPESLTPGKIIVYNDRVYIGDVNSVPMEVVTLAHELNIGTINGMSVESILDMMVDKKIGIAGASGSTIEIDPPSVSVGNTFTFGGTSWVVAHKTSTRMYAASQYILSSMQFSDDNTIVYAGSLVKAYARDMADIFSDAEKALLVAHPETGDLVSLMSQSELNGGFSYFNSDSRRICYDQGTSNATFYWTRTTYSSSSVWSVDGAGSLGPYSPSYACGFRPCIVFPL